MKIKARLVAAIRVFGLNQLQWRLHNYVVLLRFGKSAGWGGFYLEKSDLDSLLGCFSAAEEIKIDLTQSPDYINTKLNFESLSKLNLNNRYKNGADLINEIKGFDSKYGKMIQDVVRSPYRIINVRAWEMLPLKESFGPSNFHTDGFEVGHMKIMIYLSELNSKTGSIQLIGEEPLEKDKGFVLVFQNSDLVHRAIPGRDFSRNLIEITVQRLARNLNLEPTTGFCNDRHFKKPKYAYRDLK